MTACEQAQEWISAELDGELNAEETEALHEHLKSCADCREYREACRILAGLLDEPMEEAPAELLNGVMSTIKKQKKNKLRRMVLPLAGLAACIVIVIAAFPVISSGRKAAKMDTAAVMAETEESAAGEEVMSVEAPMEAFAAKSADNGMRAGSSEKKETVSDYVACEEDDCTAPEPEYSYYTENYCSVLYLWPDCSAELESYGAEPEEGCGGEDIYVIPDNELDDLLAFLGEDVQFTLYGGDADNGLMAILVEAE